MRRCALVALLTSACAVQPAPAPKSAPRPAPVRAQQDTPKGEVVQGLSRPPRDDEMRLIRGLMRDTERIRGLAFRAPVDIRIQDKAAMRAYVSSAIQEDALTRARRRYVALGLLDPDVDVRDLLESVMEEELVGYYDPKQKRLAVRDDVARSLGARTSAASDLEWRATVVHELVHALQDQHLDLATAMEAERTTDADDAFGALVEGDATLAMLGYAAEFNGVSLEALSADPRGIASTVKVTPDKLTAVMREAPAILREPLLFRYREGTMYAARLYRAGGWEQVDAAHLTPPESTLAVVDPARYLAQEPTPRLALPDLSWLADAGYERVDEDVLGGFELAVVLREGGVDARVLSRAWRGDRYAVFERGEHIATTWFVCFEGKGVTKRAAAAFGQLGTHGTPRRVTSEGTCVLATRGLDAASDDELAKRFRVWARSEQ